MPKPPSGRRKPDSSLRRFAPVRSHQQNLAPFGELPGVSQADEENEQRDPCGDAGGERQEGRDGGPNQEKERDAAERYARPGVGGGICGLGPLPLVPTVRDPSAASDDKPGL